MSNWYYICEFLNLVVKTKDLDMELKRIKMVQDIKELFKIYLCIKEEIIKRLLEFELLFKRKETHKILLELIFCLLTPQSKAKVCWRCVEDMDKNRVLFSGDVDNIKSYLKGVRFKNKKAFYIVEATKRFNEILDVIYSDKSVFEKRVWLVKNIKGIGCKEASHFLRNIGLGKDLSILDRHILKNLKFYKVIDSVPKSLSFWKYIEIEEKMRHFSHSIEIPLDHLDLLLWYKETKEIFK